MDGVKINNRAKAPFFQQFNEKVDRSLTVMSVLIKFYDKTINKRYVLIIINLYLVQCTYTRCQNVWHGWPVYEVKCLSYVLEGGNE